MNMILFFKIILTLFMTFAQEENTGDGRNGLAAEIGPILPTSIDGVTEIQPSWLLRYSISGGDGTYYELGFQNSNSNGVYWNNATISVKSETDVESLLVQLYAGVDYTMYEATYPSGVTVDDSSIGGHVGAAMLVPMSHKTYFRSDMKFNMGPGSSLYIGFGFERRFASSKDDTEESK